MHMFVLKGFMSVKCVPFLTLFPIELHFHLLTTRINYLFALLFKICICKYFSDLQIVTYLLY